MISLDKVYSSNNYGDFVILSYFSAKEVVILFTDTGFTSTVNTKNITSGNVKDKMMPVVYGIGFVGDGIHKPTVNRKHTKVYSTWKSILQRCYCKDKLKLNPTYLGCTVCDEWHNFQNFAEWYKNNYIDGHHIDKDIKVEGNRIYSPSTCLFVSQKENNKKAVETRVRLNKIKWGVK